MLGSTLIKNKQTNNLRRETYFVIPSATRKIIKSTTALRAVSLCLIQEMNALAAWTTKVAYIVMRLVEFVFLMKHKRDANELAFQRVPFDSSGKKSRE